MAKSKYTYHCHGTARVWDEDLSQWRPPATKEEIEFNRRVNEVLKKDLMEMAGEKDDE